MLCVDNFSVLSLVSVPCQESGWEEHLQHKTATWWKHCLLNDVCVEIWWNGAADWRDMSQRIVLSWQVNSSLLKLLTVSVHACHWQPDVCRWCLKLASVSTSVKMRFHQRLEFCTATVINLKTMPILSIHCHRINSFFAFDGFLKYEIFINEIIILWTEHVNMYVHAPVAFVFWFVSAKILICIFLQEWCLLESLTSCRTFNSF